jgi:hypothetical protein
MVIMIIIICKGDVATTIIRDSCCVLPSQKSIHHSCRDCHLSLQCICGVGQVQAEQFSVNIGRGSSTTCKNGNVLCQAVRT